MDLYPGEAKHLLSKLRADPSLNACTLSHTSLHDQGCQRLFRWLTIGDEENLIETEEILEGDQQRELGSMPTQTSKRERALDYKCVEEDEPNSRPRFPRSLTSLELNDVQMGDLGFRALVEWLQSLHTEDEALGRNRNDCEHPLTKLHLRFNEIQGTSNLAEAFVSALSFATPGSGMPSSSLSSLVLSNNPLSSSFRQTFFSLLLNLPSLRQLHLTMTGLTTADARVLATYIGDQEGRCKLIELYASANNMGYKGVRAVVKAIRHCWTMEKVELYSNGMEGEADGDEDEGDEDGAHSGDMSQSEDDLISSREAIMSFSVGSGCGWASLEQNLKRTLARNVFLKRQTAKQALMLLKYSRLMLQQKGSGQSTPSGPIARTPSCEDSDYSPQQVPSSGLIDTPVLSGLPKPSSSPPSSFSYLPTEVQLSILSHLAPLLTSVQRIRIFEYAVNPETLPTLRLCLPSFGGSSQQKLRIPDPKAPTPDSTASAATGIGTRSGKKVGSLRRNGRGGAAGHRHSSVSVSWMGCNCVVCQRQSYQQKWLELVGCDVYDPGVHSAS
ncbi:hypothetical protein BDZ97DRAFT_600892 [Flammula alnicola]|nr:hypothetical protein BDZ97DRAFT_600892 [Flammula alnicola]